MATATFEASLVALEGETASLTTTTSYLAWKPGFDAVMLNSASAWRLALAPKLLQVLLYDTSATTYYDYTTEAIDKSTSTHVPLDAMAADDNLYLCFASPALGIHIDMGSNVNANEATLDVDYCSTAIGPGATLTFTNVAGDSDGTASGDPSATLAQDGVYTWTLPTAWVQSKLGTHTTPLYTYGYWLRITPSAALSAAVDLNHIMPVYQNTSLGYMAAATDYIIGINQAKCGGFTLTGSTTQTLNVTWLRHS